MLTCDPSQASYIAKGLIALSVLLTLVDHAVPDSWLSRLNGAMAGQAQATIDYLSDRPERKLAELGMFGLCCGLVLLFCYPTLGSELALLQQTISQVLGETVETLLFSPLGLKLFAPIVGIVVAPLLYCVAHLCAVVCRLHPFGAIGLLGLALDMRDVGCGLGALVGA